MRFLLATLLIVSWSHSLMANSDEIDDHAHMLTPDQEEQLYEDLGLGEDFNRLNMFYKFPQTKWDECFNDITGNYQDNSMTLNCSRNRGISVILKHFLFKHFSKCVNQGLATIGAPQAQYIHLTHRGIAADPVHSPRSLHSELRAIDVRALRVRFQNGREVSFLYRNQAHHNFFEKIRSCWGQTLIQFNDCPARNGRVDRTGSIGREDKNHKSHTHISVPYCIDGKFAGNFFST